MSATEYIVAGMYSPSCFFPDSPDTPYLGCLLKLVIDMPDTM